MTLASVVGYFQRSRQLGIWGTLRRLWARSTAGLVAWGQSCWWGWRAHRGVSDAAFLRQTRGGWRSVDALLEHLASRPASSFILPHDSSNEGAAAFRRDYPEYLSAILAAADAYSRNELSLLGHNFSFPPSIDWHRDPVTGRRWPLVHRSRIDQYLFSDSAPDPLFAWELNRHQHFVALGIAFWLTNDDRYVAAVDSHIQSWISANPLQHGINWRDGLEISLRLVAWTAAFQFLRGSRTFREKTGKVFLKTLWQQTDFLSRHLQTTTPGVIPNNHILGELTGLALIGSAFPEFRKAAAWRDTALQLLSQEARSQMHYDGANKEQATGYHRFVVELLLLIVARSRQGALPPVPLLEHTLESMLEYVCGTMTPSGTVPMWGDSSSLQALGVRHDKDLWDFRPILSAGAALFARPDWKYVAGRFDEEAWVLLGADGLKSWEHLDSHPPKQTSRRFPDAGTYVIRDAWAPGTDLGFLRCGPFGLGGEGHCAHAHCDLLSIVLWVHGQPVLVDSGTYSYQDPWRNTFRLTAAHNTVMIDGNEQAVPLRKFNWKHAPEAQCIASNGARVRGVLACSGQVEFSRELIHPRPGIWELVDRFTGRAEHTLEWFFHFAPGLELDLHEEDQTVTVFKDAQSFLTVHIPAGGLRPQLRDSWYSEQYGIRQRNRELYAQWRGELDSNGASFRWRFQVVKESSQAHERSATDPSTD